MSGNYWLMYAESALSSEEPTAVFTLFFLFAARMLPIIAQSPFLGARVLPHPVKIAFTICLFAIFLPHLTRVSTTVPLLYNPMSILLFAKELVIGYLIGLIISVPFIIVQSAGMFIDHQRGGASLMVNDPTIQNQSSPLGTLFNFVLIYIFFMIDGPFLFIEVIMKSYDIVPPDQFLSSIFFQKHSAFRELSQTILNKVMYYSIQFAAPALIMILMTDVFLGIANRLAPQVQITFLGLPLKSLLALLVLCVGWQVLAGQMVENSYRWLRILENSLYMFNPAAAQGLIAPPTE